MAPSAVEGPLSVIVVDDDDLFRRTVHVLLDAEDDLQVVGEAGDPYDALQLWRHARPDLVLLDERMEPLNGLAVAARILSDDPLQAIVIVTAHASGELLAAAAMLGVRDVIDKADLDRLPGMLRRHGSGRRRSPVWLGPSSPVDTHELASAGVNADGTYFQRCRCGWATRACMTETAASDALRGHLADTDPSYAR